MKTAFLSGLFFFIGLGLGGGMMVLLIKNGPEKVIQGDSMDMVEMNAVYATLLHDKQDADLARILDRQLAASLVYQEKLGLDDERHSSARLVRGYYDIAGVTPPADIAPYVAGVKGNDVRRLAAFMVQHTR